MKIQDADPPEYHLMMLNMQIREMMNGVLRPHGLKLVEWRLLQSLENGPLSICDLAQLAVIERTTTSRLVDKLVSRGDLVKMQMSGDRRFSQVSLSGDGRARLTACSEDVAAARAELFSGLKQGEIRQFLETLNRMQGNAASVARGRRSRLWPAQGSAG